jgi:hypothetical protein
MARYGSQSCMQSHGLRACKGIADSRVYRFYILVFPKLWRKFLRRRQFSPEILQARGENRSL